MPRRAFLADIKHFTDGDQGCPTGVSDVQHGPDDNEFQFNLTILDSVVRITAHVPETSEYPGSHEYHLFLNDDGDEAPAWVAPALGNLSASPPRSMTVSELLCAVSAHFATNPEEVSHEMGGISDRMSEDEPDEDEPGDLDDDELEFDSDDEDGDGWQMLDDSRPQNSIASDPFEPTSEFKERVRSDLIMAKNAGFKVGCFRELLEGSPCYLSISCRALKLGISEEAMRAWGINSADYMTLLLYYPAGYRSLDVLNSCDPKRARELVKFQVGKGRSYKPAGSDISDLFQDRHGWQSEAPLSAASGQQAFQDLFISKPLKTLLNDRLIHLIKYRLKFSMTWKDAEDHYDVSQGKISTEHSTAGGRDSNEVHASRVITAADAYPKRVTSDHLAEGMCDLSFPLIAMQFFLRHLVRCTEFCLVCYCHIDEDVEAIKPYVCNKPLCLYQYMSLGFGPSIEHEICTQPSVVDLLVSFCYTSASYSALKDFPLGMEIKVPLPPLIISDDTETFEAEWFPSKGLIVAEASDARAIKQGEWINVEPCSADQVAHYMRVLDVFSFPSIQVGPAFAKESSLTATESLGSAYEGALKVKLRPHKTSFDDLDTTDRCKAICETLKMLPPIDAMKNTILKRPKDGLTVFQDSVPPASLSILRWIIASSRACIMEVDSLEENESGSWEISPATADNRLGGMEGWMQFRFATGAPDKERRFLDAVQDARSRLRLEYPTFFAWHGSPLKNWHSIVREGLRFDLTAAHGRAFGNGVYHSLDANTSLSYSSMNYRHGGNYDTWPGSALRVNSAIALNEIVNAPSEFVSKAPHLVVSQIDWIQTRYLLIKVGVPSPSNIVTPNSNLPDNNPPTSSGDLHPQDPAMTPHGQSRKKITIPATAVPRSRRKPSVVITVGNKKLRGDGTLESPVVLDIDEATWEDDNASVLTNASDVAVIDPNDALHGEAQSHDPILDETGIPRDTNTDYIPGQLDSARLPLMAEPSWASSTASKRLQNELKTALKTQQSELPSVLGWTIDARFTDNLYQWIVELHSFAADLQLTRDMKRYNINSVVLEMRFGPSFPLSPPFIRVISPRFVPFMSGGGGNVTAGGAMCMELLTNSGWSPVQDIQAVILQVRMAISSPERPAKLMAGASHQGDSYGIAEATQAFIRACKAHGWDIPADFHEMARASGGVSSGGF